ncbi:hypothetical protein TNCV_310251 [Trichonephila clavipes]|nr:hypothetical protein TNCV_310251 [Trichonephila clavipes]
MSPESKIGDDLKTTTLYNRLERLQWQNQCKSLMKRNLIEKVINLARQINSEVDSDDVQIHAGIPQTGVHNGGKHKNAQARQWRTRVFNPSSTKRSKGSW